MPQNAQKGEFPQDQRGKIKAIAMRATSYAFGEFGLQSLDGGWLIARIDRAGRVTASHFMRGEGRFVHPRLPAKSAAVDPARNRMGKGKGERSSGPPHQGRTWYCSSRRRVRKPRPALPGRAWRQDPFKCRFVTPGRISNITA